MRFEQTNYEAMRVAQAAVGPQTYDELVTMCQRNAWLKRGGIPFEDDPCFEQDSPYSFTRIDDAEMLEAFFDHGNWSIRQGVLHGDLAFINQINGGDEWWTLKRFDGRWVPFESITWRRIIKDGEFSKFLGRLTRATLEGCKRLTY